MHRSSTRPKSSVEHPLRTLLLFLSLMLPIVLRAQTGGEAGIQGTVTDPTGAVIPHATVTATNTATNVSTTRETTSDGLFTISPVPAGTYTVSVAAPGFSQFVQKNLAIDALKLTGLNVQMQTGSQSSEITVTEAPPALETTNATLGLTIENESYANLPLQVNGQQRDPTAFAALTPGAQSGARLPIIGGTGNYLGQLYLDGLPAETVSQQGDNRLISLTVSVDAVDQFQVITSTPSAEYSGAGAENFTLKSGGSAYHGQVSDFVRNTIFDAWRFTTKAATVRNAAGVLVPAPKNVEHQNELSASFGGHVPFLKDKLFFFVAYDRFHGRNGANYTTYNVPTALERAGDFTELNSNVGGGGLTGTGSNNPAFLYDPTSTTCSGTTCTRAPFAGLKNGLPTYNVIPAGYLSPIAQAAQAALPLPTNPASLTNNYLGGQPSGFDNQVFDYRVDYDLSKKQRISTIGAVGVENYVNNFATPFFPVPYVGGDLAVVHPKNFDVEDRYIVSNSIVNQLKFGFVRFFQNIQNATQGVTAYEAPTLGIGNLPPGQAAQEFPGAAFGTTTQFGTALTGWTTNSNTVATQLTTPNNFTLVDNLQLVKGKHSLTFGVQAQWQEINNANPATYTGVLDLTYNGFSTAAFANNSSSLSSGSGYSYASFLLGAVGGTPSIGLQPVSEEGGRYRPIAPYVEDTYKVNAKLTIDAGLRWDYLPPYHEVKDRWTFLNPGLTNPATGTPGELQFAGNYGGAGVSCGCRTPVQTYWKNFGPRVGVAYSVDDKTVFRVGAGRVFTQGGGVGGRAGAFNGTGQTGFNVTATGPQEATTGAAAGPSFYLNNGPTFTSRGIANTSLFGAGYAYPTPPTPGAASQTLNSGYYLNSAGRFVTAAGVAYADPYFSGRAPDFNFYNAGLQRSITSNITLSVNYVGNESHHLINSTSSAANARGYWSNQLDPKYLLALGGVTDSTNRQPILISAATPANVAKAQAAFPGLNIPAFFQSAALSSTTATIAQGLTAFPQYNGITDTWGQNVGNFSYNSLQITLAQRFAKGLTYNINYTYSKNIGDDGTFRSGFAIPAGAVSGSSLPYAQDRIERSWTTVSGPESLHAFGVYKLPFGGGGQLGSSNLLLRTLTGGWQLSGIYTYGSGTPVAVISTTCTTNTSPLQGQCTPDTNPAFFGKNARTGGSYGTGPNGTTACNLGIGAGCVAIPYFSNTAFQNAADIVNPSIAAGAAGPHQFLLGNAPRTRPFNLNNPGSQNLDTALHRTVSLPREMSFIFEVDCLNTWNKVQFSNPSASWSSGSATFGTISSVANLPRDFQFAAHLTF